MPASQRLSHLTLVSSTIKQNEQEPSLYCRLVVEIKSLRGLPLWASG